MRVEGFNMACCVADRMANSKALTLGVAALRILYPRYKACRNQPTILQLDRETKQQVTTENK